MVAQMESTRPMKRATDLVGWCQKQPPKKGLPAQVKPNVRKDWRDLSRVAVTLDAEGLPLVPAPKNMNSGIVARAQVSFPHLNLEAT